jgi:hypothetical protein
MKTQEEKDKANEYARAYRAKNKEKIKEKDKDYRVEEKREKYLENKKRFYEKNKEKIRKEQEEYYKNNKEKINIINNKNYEINKEKRNLQNKKWKEKNINRDKELKKNWYEKNKKSIREKIKKRKEEDTLFKLKTAISSRLRNGIKSQNFSKNFKTKEILGCTYEEFKIYIESKFESWMTWDNYGKYNGQLNYGWDLDHIIPIHISKTEDDIIKLNHNTNFQPLCSKINRDIKRHNY